MHTINGIFPGSDGALRASEQAREVVKMRSAIRVFTYGPNRKVVETAVVDDTTGWPRVTILAVVLGAVGAGVLAGLGASATYVLFWSLWAVAAGIMFTLWLKGQRHSRDLLRANERPTSQVEEEIRAGNAVMTASVATEAEAEQVTSVIEKAGGHIVDGSFEGHPAWHLAHPPAP
jgi:hypothetical protein